MWLSWNPWHSAGSPYEHGWPPSSEKPTVVVWSRGLQNVLLLLAKGLSGLQHPQEGVVDTRTGLSIPKAQTRGAIQGTLCGAWSQGLLRQMTWQTWRGGRAQQEGEFL